jgi:hypothetical protein
MPDIQGEHDGVTRYEHLDTGVPGTLECGDARGVAGMLTPTTLLAVASVMWQAWCLDRLRRAPLDAAALAMMSPVGIAPSPAWVAGSMRAVADSDDRAVARRAISALLARHRIGRLHLQTGRITGPSGRRVWLIGGLMICRSPEGALA